MSVASRQRASCAAAWMVAWDLPVPSTPTTMGAFSGSIVTVPVCMSVTPGLLMRGVPGFACTGQAGPNTVRRPGAVFRLRSAGQSTGVTSSSKSPGLRKYARVADGQRGALIGPDGTIDWLCAPRWDSPAVFSGLLGGQGGYGVTPTDPWNVWGGYYETGSLIW